MRCIFKELTATQWAERQKEGKLDHDAIMPSHYFISAAALIHCLCSDCASGTACLYRGMWHNTVCRSIHLNSLSSQGGRTRGGWNVNFSVISTQKGKKAKEKKKRLTSTFQLRSTLPCFILFLSADSLPFSPHDSIFLLSISTVRLCSPPPPPPPPLPSVPPVLFLSPKNKNKAADRTLPRSLCLPAPFYSVVKVKRQVDLCRPPPSSLSPSRADSIPFTSH